MLVAHARSDAAVELDIADDGVQVHADWRQVDWMVLSSHAKMQVLKHSVAYVLAAEIVDVFLALHAFEHEDRAELIFNFIGCILELLQVACPHVGRVRFLTVEHHASHASFGFRGWQEGQGQGIGAFVVRAFSHELHAPFFVDCARGAIREGSAHRVARRFATYLVAMDHPARAKTQCVVEPGRNCGQLIRRATSEVLSPEVPGSHEGTILAKHDAVVDHGRVVQPVSQAFFFCSVFE